MLPLDSCIMINYSSRISDALQRSAFGNIVKEKEENAPLINQHFSQNLPCSGKKKAYMQLNGL